MAVDFEVGAFGHCGERVPHGSKSTMDGFKGEGFRG